LQENGRTAASVPPEMSKDAIIAERCGRLKLRCSRPVAFPRGGEGLPMLQGVVGTALVSLERKDHRIIGTHEAYTEVDAVVGAQTVIAAIAFGRR